MKLLFICGSLEPGKDGVGDYTRRLAGECIRLGHQALILAIHDRMTLHVVTDPVLDEEISIQGLRIPSVFTLHSKCKLAQEFIDHHNPDWVSVQFVLFAFQSKGVPVSIGYVLRSLLRRRKSHIMLHELWIGVYGPTSYRSKMLGVFQKACMLWILSCVRFSSVSTSNLPYLKELKRYTPFLLPVFGNIPLSQSAAFQKINNNELCAVVFGTITADLKQFREQIQWLHLLSQSMGLQLELYFIGNGGKMEQEARILSAEFIGKSHIHVLGFLEEHELSSMLLKMDFGISRADYHLFTKSGTTMTLLEHGLPVLLKGDRPIKVNHQTGTLFDHQLHFKTDALPDSLHRYPFCNGLNKIANQFIENLEKVAITKKVKENTITLIV